MKELRRILFVEDEPDIREIVRLTLELVGGFEVQACATGNEALQRLQNFIPDFILLDVMMPDMDGPATLVALRALPGMQTLPVAFVTAKVQPAEIAQLRALGATGVIAKPFDPITLPAQVLALWGAACL